MDLYCLRRVCPFSQRASFVLCWTCKFVLLDVCHLSSNSCQFQKQGSFVVSISSSFLCIRIVQDATSLSLGFLFQAFIADSSNLISCILSGQLATQIVVALYFVSTDIIVIFQYFYYSIMKKHFQKWWNSKRNKDQQTKSNVTSFDANIHHHEDIHEDEAHDNHQVTLLNPNVTKSSSPTRLNIKVAFALLMLLLFFSFKTMHWQAQYESQQSLVYPQRIYTSTNSFYIGRKLFSSEKYHQLEQREQDDNDWSKHDAFVFPPNTTISIVGYAIGWFCALLYLGSRPPQIYKNFKRGSAAGVSRIFFSLAVLGNSCYVASIWLFSFNGRYLMMRLPFLLETSVNVCMDSFILFQIIYYHRKNLKKDSNRGIEHVQLEEGRPIEFHQNNDENSIELENHEHDHQQENLDDSQKSSSEKLSQQQLQ